MSLQLVHFSNCGGYRPTNQDGYCVRVSLTSAGLVSMLAVCDGMGGMNGGEIASSTVIHSLGVWFDNFSQCLTPEQLTPETVSAELNRIVEEQHSMLLAYGEKRDWHIGTTLSVILLTRARYFLLHVGDSRIYLTDAWETRQLTRDQTLAMQELEAGHITADEYRYDSRQNVLLQCVGDRSVSPVFLIGETPQEGGVLLCSDGFYHTVRQNEVHKAMRRPGGREAMRQCLLALANRAREQGERDNITCVAYRWTKESLQTEGPEGSLASISFMNGKPL